MGRLENHCKFIKISAKLLESELFVETNGWEIFAAGGGPAFFYAHLLYNIRDVQGIDSRFARSGKRLCFCSS